MSDPMSDPIPGSLEDANPHNQSHLSLDNFGPKSQIYPPLKYEVCAVCGFIYRRDRMVRYKRKWYCRQQDCNRDVVGIELSKSPEVQFKNRSLSERFWKGGAGSGRSGQ